MGFFDHCQPKQRFNAYNSNSFPWGLTTWQTIDWDQRRYISTSVPECVEEDDDDDGSETSEGRIIQALSELVDQLDDDVNLVNFSTEGDFIPSSSETEDDTAFIPLYCPLDMIPEQYRTTGRVVSRTGLVEIDRLSQCVDLVTYRSQPGSKAVFKYQFHHDQALRNWHELNCWLRLSGHPNIVPLECLVTDHEDVPGHGTNIEVVVGFTSTFVPGGTFDKSPSRLFKLKYLEQLVQVVDDLNLKFGIVHQDIAPRNLLVSPATDTLQLFDFSCSGKLGRRSGDSAGQQHFTNSGSFEIDLKGVVATVYEIITRDTQLAEQILLGAADTSTIEEKEWIKHPDVNLDTDVGEYRATIREWLLQRRSRPENLITHYTQALSPLEWPEPWQPKVPSLDESGNALEETASPVTCVPRTALRALGLKFVEWERPAHNRIPDGFRVLGDGTLIAEADLERDGGVMAG